MTLLLPIARNGLIRTHSDSSLLSILAALVSILLTSTSCLAELTCLPDLEELILPSVADCRFVLAHLPSITPSSPKDADTPMVPDFPFLPSLRIRHETCQFQFHWIYEPSDSP